MIPRPAFVHILWLGAPPSIPAASAEPTAPEPPAFRPNVGPVLSGGGAGGIRPIGVLELLEELDMPVVDVKEYVAPFPSGLALGLSDGEVRLSKGAIPGSSLEPFRHELTQ